MTGMTRRSDTKIYEWVIDELLWDRKLEGANIQVEVHDGVVVLIGAVTSDTRRSAAEDAASRVRGVQSVENYLNVIGWTEEVDATNTAY